MVLAGKGGLLAAEPRARRSCGGGWPDDKWEVGILSHSKKKGFHQKIPFRETLKTKGQ